MKLLTYQPEIRVNKHYAGLMEVDFKHEIKSASAELKYLGPRLDPEVWKQVLAFFQWTYDTTHSESQVRLYVHVPNQRWAAWAYPQEARTGMTARELDTDDAKKQRAQFSENDGWQYFGTVHHHCSATAFQSGTDRANEERIDGLHITIGQMASSRYDMHARFYLGGFCFEPDMAKFWAVPPNLAILLPPDLHDRIARWNMCEKVEATAPFPEAWKQNLIEVKTTFPIHGNGGYVPSTTTGYQKDYRRYQGGKDYSGIPKWLLAKRALGEFALEALANPYDRGSQIELSEWIQEIATGTGQGMDKVISTFIEILLRYELDPMDMWTEVPPDNTLSACISAYKHHAGLDDDRGGSSKPTQDDKAKELGWDGHMMD